MASVEHESRSGTLDADELMADARADTGLDDFGDELFVEPLRRFLSSAQAEGQLSAMGMAGLKADVDRLLCNRLRIRAAISAHPEILDEDVADPIVITGVPRTGTTKLQKVIAANPGFQYLPLWRGLYPAPLADPGTEPDPRVTIVDQQTAMLSQFPDLMAGHPMETHEPEEDLLLLQLSFRTPVFGMLYRAPSYVDWLAGEDQAPAYADLREALQYLQWQDGGRRNRPWVLKTPLHLGALDHVFTYFPKATVVVCHRDIHDAVPSMARLFEVMAISRGVEGVEPEEYGRFCTEHFAQMWVDHIRLRRTISASRVMDVAYGTIRDDVKSVLSDIYRLRGTSLDEAALKAVAEWEGDNPQHRHGKHEYSLERFGLTRSRIDTAFAEYLERFADFADA